MKTLDNYIKLIFDDMVQYESKVSREFLDKKSYFQKNKYLWIDGIEEEVFEWEIESVFIPNSRQWERMEEDFKNLLDTFEIMINSNIQRSILSEIEVLKNNFIDIWESDKLHFKQEYLEGKRLDLESKNLTMDRALLMFAEDLASVQHYNNIENRVKELEENNQEQLIKNNNEIPKKPSVRALAMYHTFLIETKVEPPFDKRKEGRKVSMSKILEGKDDKHFRTELKAVSTPKGRQNIKYESDFRECIELLNNDTIKNKDAIAKAQSELKIICPL